MSLKDLFASNSTVVSNKSLSDLTSSFNLESFAVISESLLRDDLLIPNINFSDPSQFVRYGLAKKYYTDSIKKIYKTYPWDGSKRQKLVWRNNASFLDLHLFDKEYPKQVGYATIGTTFGTASLNSDGSVYKSPGRIEYIKIGTGLASGSVFSESNRTSVFSMNSEDGFCVEFAMNAHPWSPDIATASLMTVFAFSANQDDISNGQLPDASWDFLIGISGSELHAVSSGDGGGYGPIAYNAFSFNEWNFFTINYLSGGIVDIWRNGIKMASTTGMPWCVQPTTVRFSGTIGALSEFGYYSPYIPDSTLIGANKFSGSLDEFRFWRRARTDKEIVTNWFCTLDGGFDDDELLNPDMAFYYKFNEGTTGTSSIDAVVLDYSGRKNHALWVGYVSGSRSDTSWMDSEVGDPIIYSSSFRVQNFLQEKEILADDYDLNNNSALINNLPSFLQDEDEGENLQNITQILGSYFDRLWLQIDALTSMRDTAYFTSGSLASDILRVAIESNGLPISNILDNYSLAEIISEKNDSIVFEQSIENIKRIIYKNIYNNLIYIFKSKGTEKSIKSIFRIFGVDDELLKIKTYSNSSFEINGNEKYETVRRRNYLDLTAQNDSQNRSGVVFNQYTSSVDGSIGNISQYSVFQKAQFPNTLEINFNLPKFGQDITSSQQVSASLFGFYELDRFMAETSTNNTWKQNGFSFNAFSVKKEHNSSDGKFVLKFSQPEIAPHELSNLTLETPWYSNLFNDSKWTFALRTFVSGTQQGLVEFENVWSNPYLLDIRLIQELGGQVIHTYSYQCQFTGSHTSSFFAPFFTETKVYAGALRTNFTGSVQMQTNMKLGSVRLWRDFLTDEDILNHALDTDNFGISNMFKSALGVSISKDSTYGTVWNRLFLSKMESCMMNWDFQKEYIADGDGKFLVHSFRGKSSYSQSLDANFYFTGSAGFVLQGSNYTGLGYGFNSGTLVTGKDYIIAQKNREIQNLLGANSVQVLDKYDEFFDTRRRPIEFFYTIENSIYSVISEEILNFFSSIDDFNNLIGEPVHRFRMKYKQIDIMRAVFFSKLSNSNIDINKYMSYYNWIDQSISNILRSLFPASANVDSSLRTVIESHALERNKYMWQYALTKNKPNQMISGTVQPMFRKFTLR